MTRNKKQNNSPALGDDVDGGSNGDGGPILWYHCEGGALYKYPLQLYTTIPAKRYSEGLHSCTKTSARKVYYIYCKIFQRNVTEVK